MISDTSEYPKEHSFFCHSDDDEISSRSQALLERIVDERSRTIKDLVDWFCTSLAKINTSSKAAESDEESGDDSDVFDYDDEMDTIPISSEPSAILTKLQENFVELIAHNYKPGRIRTTGGNDFILSVSIPVIRLAETIPPRALMAWDRRLLSRYQHLVLLISGFHGLYPVLNTDGTYTPAASQLQVNLTFKVGLSGQYKPGKEQAQDVVRKHGLIQNDAEDELRILEEKLAQEKAMAEFWDADADEVPPEEEEPPKEEEPEDPGRFDRFSLTSSLESLFQQSFVQLVQLRRRFDIGWAGAELLLGEMEKTQVPADHVYASHRKQIHDADKHENNLARSSVKLPDDPLSRLEADQAINLPLTAFSYLIRRLTLCTKYCVVCHNELQTDFEALKPYVCENKLCSFQYYAMGRGPSLEYEIIHNPRTVDLLVSLAYVSATEGTMGDPLPVGLGLQVPHPGVLAPGSYTPQASRPFAMPGQPAPAENALVPTLVAGLRQGDIIDFDTLNKAEMRAVIAKLIDSLPSVEDMGKHLTRKVRAGKSKPKLNDIDPDISPAAWLILRWIIGSCTAYIEEIVTGDERIKNLDPNWRQFRLTVGAPDAEAKFKKEVEAAARKDSNAAQYPALYAFHGSPLRNWHSIIRHGLWYKEIAHGRAYGNGVYLAKDGNVSMGTYAQGARAVWKRSQTSPTNCVALVEMVNLPNQFVSNNPYFVVAETSWLVCRYLLLKGGSLEAPPADDSKSGTEIPFVKLDPAHKATLNGKLIEIPDPSAQVDSIISLRQAEVVEEDYDEEDMEVFTAQEPPPRQAGNDHGGDEHDFMDVDDENDYKVPTRVAPKAPPPPPRRPANDWKHDSEYVREAVENLMLPPFESTSSASNALKREMRDMLREQENAPSLRELGWYIPEDHIQDNLYQWIVELHSFDPDIPIAKDLKAKNINSVIFEIRFPPDFPVAPPFFRIITPRFLPFIHGGGGHVTGGWLPSYSIPAVLMQIKLAISNLDPRPARLAQNWQQPYAVREALEGFKRAAATHNWRVPDGLERLVR
ncbi:hypothetical protein BKA70DRAFT_1372977 [Coprinopsis sp. MPI-PUGE-AT-0042]|nr:hypothetical protein BKA70DRAFT_1372977 [Coprinopsis sp. MPI-PUGE-AT-0042]